MRKSAIAVLAGLLLVAGCGTSGTGAVAPSSGPTTLSGPYVALGDSYTAAPHIAGGAVLGAAGQPAGCGRSRRNYPRLVARRLDLTLADESCNGATTADLAGQQQVGSESAPAQLDALTPETALVTLGIGGNDDAIFVHLVSTCFALAQQDPTGAPCTKAAGMDVATARREIAQVLGGRLTSVVAEIAARSPHARILLVGYPQIVPATGHCAQMPLAAGDYAYARGIIQGLNDGMAQAAQAGGATYVDTWTASAGHDICAAHPWIAGAVPAGPAAPFHPYAVEQRAVAGLVEKALGQA
ncbi:MAG TPA: GDSL-type esterase/lipase family protein [Nocardioides sp.]|nr:GDSL-type esterase/lipase family protein [Nocardioides sp.]